MYIRQKGSHISQSVYDRANSSIVEYHKNRSRVDHTFVMSVFIAQERVELDILKIKHPGKTVSWNGRIGCVVYKSP